MASSLRRTTYPPLTIRLLCPSLRQYNLPQTGARCFARMHMQAEHSIGWQCKRPTEPVVAGELGAVEGGATRGGPLAAALVAALALEAALPTPELLAELLAEAAPPPPPWSMHAPHTGQCTNDHGTAGNPLPADARI